MLIIGYGDVGQRCPTLLRTCFRVLIVTLRLEDRAMLREMGAVPIVTDLDDAASLRRLRGLSLRVLHLVPPPAVGNDDPRVAALLRALVQPSPDSTATKHRTLPGRARKAGSLTGRLKTPLQARAFVYANINGIYGDAGDAQVDESHPVKPRIARVQHRVATEHCARWFGAGGARRTSILRIPGIYAADRLPVVRLERGMPALHAQDNVYTNYIHVDDLAYAVVAALFRGRPQRIVHATDAPEPRMGDYLDVVVDARGLQHPPHISRVKALQQIEPALLSFMSEPRRSRNTRSAHELRVALRYPTVMDFLNNEV